MNCKSISAAMLMGTFFYSIDVLPFDPLYSWISSGTHNQNSGKIRHYGPKEKTDFQTDVMFPSNVNIDAVRATIAS